MEKAFGAESRAKVVEALPEAERALCSRALLSSEWVPFRAQVAVYQTADRLLGKGDLALCRRIGRYTCEAELSTINRIFLQVASLETWIRSAGLMWRRYYTAGALKIEDFGSKRGNVLITDFNPIHRAFCEDFAGWLERTVELSGHRDVTMRHAACLLEGAPACRYEMTWS